MKKIIIRLLMATTLLLSGCVGGSGSSPIFQTPQIKLLSLTPKSINNGQIAFDVGLAIQNPNGIALPINDVNSQIALNGLSLLSARGTADKMIPANGSGQMTLSTSVGLDKIQQLVRTLNGGNISYQMSGDVGVAGMGNFLRLPFNQSGQVNAVELTQTLLKSQLGW